MSSDVGLFGLMNLRATEPVAKLVAALHAFRPDVLAPYPSVAALLAREQIAGRLSIAPRVVVTHSELLTPEMARLIEQAWGSKPFNHYGMTEEPHVAGDCPAHAGLRVLEDTSMIEVVDDAYRPVPDGSMGTRYLLTNLYNRAQPLIRYEVTEMLCKSPALCPCGRPFALLSAIGGRAEDILRLPRADGGEGAVAVTPMVIGQPVEAFIGLCEYAVEHDAQGIRMRLVVPEEADRRRILDELLGRIVADLARHGAAAPPTAIEFIGQLPRSEQRMGKIAVVARRKPAAP